jgi:hypothetical protein
VSAGDGEGDRDDQQRVASVPWNGLDTTISLDKFLASVRIVASPQKSRESRSDGLIAG